MIKMKMIPNFQNQNLNKRKREKKKKISTTLMHCTVYFAVLTSAIVPLEVRQKKNNTTARLSRVHERKNYNRKNSVSGACALKIVKRESESTIFIHQIPTYKKNYITHQLQDPQRKPHTSAFIREKTQVSGSIYLCTKLMIQGRADWVYL